MPLLTIWKSNPAAIDQFSIEQVVTAAGDGVLKDGSDCSAELRIFLSEVPSAKLKSYIERCLSTPLNKGGMVLQDLVNELGRRLEYNVENGRYQGVVGSIGFDGLWRSGEHTIVVEVKTTDAYRISLNTIASYRDKLMASGKLLGSNSFVIVTGREDTGELEAQVRGSRHAWDIRLISTDALVKLVQLKEDSEGPETSAKIRSLLTPMEYAIPAKIMHECLSSLRTTEDRYWHVDLSDTADGHLEMYLAKTKRVIPLAAYAIALK